MNFWLMKNEPEDYDIDDLARDKTEPWDGIRNYQVRNMIRDEMRIGDNAFFYHSNCETPGIYGQMTICKEAYCLLYTSPSPRDQRGSRMPSSA